jgi:AAA family ATP:ADP antiporter
MEAEAKLSSFRKRFFPIYDKEFKKFFPLTSIFFCITLNYGLLRGIKDTLLMTMKGGGSEAIAAAKFFGVLPFMFIFKIVYDAVSRRGDRDLRFNFILTYFLAFFLCYRFVIYPHPEMFQFHGAADWLEANASRLGKLALMFRQFNNVVFYIHAEAWGAFTLSVLFWTFVNGIVDVHQSKRFYSPLSVGAAIATSLAGLLICSTDLFTLDQLFILVIVVILTLLVSYNIFSKALQKAPEAYQVPKKKSKKKKKVKLSILQSLTYIFKSSYLMLIAVLVVGYSFFITLFEAVYRDCLKEYTGNSQEIMRYFAGLQLVYIGILSMVFIFFIAPTVSRRSWKFMALITPSVALFSTLLFFAFVFMGKHFTFLGWEEKKLLYYSVFVGMTNVIFIKSAKYIFFDPSKERSYIPLDEESKIRGKSAVDGLGSRIGKGGGALVVNILVIIFGVVRYIRVPLAITIILILVAWIAAASRLSVLFEAKVAEEDESDRSVDSKVAEAAIKKVPAQPKKTPTKKARGEKK